MAIYCLTATTGFSNGNRKQPTGQERMENNVQKVGYLLNAFDSTSRVQYFFFLPHLTNYKNEFSNSLLRYQIHIVAEMFVNYRQSRSLYYALHNPRVGLIFFFRQLYSPFLLDN